MKMNSTPLSNYLRMLRENNKLRQNDLANLLGISRSAYSHYETAQTVPTTDSLRIIADYYKVSLEKLVRLSGGDFNSQAQNPCKEKRNAKERAERNPSIFCQKNGGRAALLCSPAVF